MNSPLNRHKWEPYLWLLPSIILIAVFVVFPIIIVFKLSFSEISKAGVIGGYIGFQNYRDAVHLPAFRTVMLNTFWWVISVVGISTILGFVVAMVFNQKFRGRKIARAILVFPWATSLVIQASVWNYIIKYEYGSLNSVLLNLGIIKQAINWRSSYQIEFIWECGVGIFVTIPFVTFCVLSGLQSIDHSLYESAIVDGAGRLRRIWSITLPCISSTIIVLFIMQVGNIMNAGFDQTFNMMNTAVKPVADILDTYVYWITFRATPSYGFSAAVGMFKSVINFAMLIVADRVIKRLGGNGMFA